MFPNFLRSSVLSRSTTHIYQFNTNNHILFHLWWKGKLPISISLKTLWTWLYVCASIHLSIPAITVTMSIVNIYVPFYIHTLKYHKNLKQTHCLFILIKINPLLLVFVVKITFAVCWFSRLKYQSSMNYSTLM